MIQNLVIIERMFLISKCAEVNASCYTAAPLDRNLSSWSKSRSGGYEMYMWQVHSLTLIHPNPRTLKIL